MSEDDHPGPFWDLDFNTMINLIKGVEDPASHKRDLLSTFRTAFAENTEQMRRAIRDYVPREHQDTVNRLIIAFGGSTAALAMLEYEVASIKKRNDAGNLKKLSKADRERVITWQVAEEHRNKITGELLTAGELKPFIDKRRAEQASPLSGIHIRKIYRHLDEGPL